MRLQAALAGRAPVSVSDDEERVLIPVGVLTLLLEQAAQTEILRRKYQRQQALLQDKRVKPGEKVVAAAVGDLAGPGSRWCQRWRNGASQPIRVRPPGPDAGAAGTRRRRADPERGPASPPFWYNRSALRGMGAPWPNESLEWADEV